MKTSTETHHLNLIRQSLEDLIRELVAALAIAERSMGDIDDIDYVKRVLARAKAAGYKPPLTQRK
jgi:hypothetical protein